MAVTTCRLNIVNDISEAEAPSLDDTVPGNVDFKGLPAARRKTGCWKSASFIIGVEMAERFTYYGIFSNLITYLTGSLGQSTATAAANVNTWSGAALLWTLLGAFFADSFMGQYRMIIVASLLYLLGLGSLSLSSALHSKCKNELNNSECSLPQLEIIIFLSLYLVGFAQGGYKPCVQAFGADQFDDEDPGESIEKSSFFNWWNFSLSIAVFIAFFAMSYIQENISWELGIGLLCSIMCVSLVVFLLGSMTYRFRIELAKSRVGLVLGGCEMVWVIIGYVTIYHPFQIDVNGWVDKGCGCIHPTHIYTLSDCFDQLEN